MKKLLSLIGAATIGTLGTSTAVSSYVEGSNFLVATFNSQAEEDLTIEYQEETGSILLIHGNEYVFTIGDDINLTANGIANIEQLHQYKDFEIPNMYVQVETLWHRGDTWNPKNKEIGVEDWHYVRTLEYRATRTEIYSSASLWINETNNNLMMRLSYKAVAIYFGARQTFSWGTGSRIIFHK